MNDVLPRLLLVLAWCAMVLIGVFFIASSGEPRGVTFGVVVGQKLPANFYFLTGDKTPASAAGRYVASSKGADVGAVLRSGDLAERPAIPVFREPKLLLSAPVATAAIRAGLNAGAHVRICGKGETSYGEATIQFVACDDRAGNEAFCTAVVEASDRAALETLGKAVKDKTALSEIHIAEACK